MAAILALVGTCVALGVAAIGTQFMVSSQDELAGRIAAQTQQISQLSRFPAQLAAMEADFRSQAAMPRATLTARFSQSMSQLDAAANTVIRNYPEGSSTRVQFRILYVDLRTRYDAAYRALTEDLAGNRRNDYLVIHADAISQASQTVSSAATGLLDDELRRMPVQASAMASSGHRMSEVWIMAGLVVLGIMLAYAFAVARGAGKVLRVAEAVQANRTVAMSDGAAPAQAETTRARSAVSAEELPGLIDEAIPVALAGELKTGVLFVGLTSLDHLSHDHTAEEIEALQIGIRDSISAALRPSDVVARLGEGEYGILLAEMRQRGDFVPIEQRIRRAITFAQMRFPQFAGKNIALRTNSAMYPIDGYSGEELLSSARAMGVAKRAAPATPAEPLVAAAVADKPRRAPEGTTMLAEPVKTEVRPVVETRKPVTPVVTPAPQPPRNDRDDLIFT